MIKACKLNDNLTYNDEVSAMQKNVRIFIYDKNINPDAFNDPLIQEFKGLSFEMDGDQPIDIISRPIEKIKEIPTDLKFNNVDIVTKKIDGHMVSSYISGGYPFLKTAESLYSDEALSATALLNSTQYLDLRKHITENVGYTYNFEYTSPETCIVLNYDEPRLTLLSVRNNISGEDVPLKQLFSDSILRKYLVEFTYFKDSDSFFNFLDNIKCADNVEGVVITTKENKKFKLKSDWYKNVYRLKNHVLESQNLVYYVAESETDDLKQAFKNQKNAIHKIEVYEQAFITLLKTTIPKVENFYKQNHGYDIMTFTTNATIESSNDPEYLYKCFVATYKGLDFDLIVDILKDYYINNYQKLVTDDIYGGDYYVY